SVEVKSVNSLFFGRYTSTNSQREFELNDRGVFVHQNQIQSISRKTLRESTKYRLAGEYLHGVIVGDSVQVVQEGELLYFGIPVTEQLIGGDSKNQLKEISANTLLLNFFEEGVYVPCLISIINREMRLQYFDYADSTNAFDTFEVVSSKEEKGLLTQTLRPSMEQFVRTDLKQIFGSEIIYRKEL
ncbi:MAG: hypothetical protein KJ941_06610, partial [Bacteroidetes bacterium]|nr:hypothetical protein [Bacteroidota bacterium]